MRGILLKPLAIETRDGVVHVIPAGSQVDVESDDDWYHDCSRADIEEAVDMLWELPDGDETEPADHP